MRPTSTLILTASLILIGILCAAPQTPAQQTAGIDPQPSLLSQLFPKTTGLNGYEELVMAADLVRNNQALEQAQQEGAPLAAMRHALADKDLHRALQLLHEGLEKPIASPRDMDQVDEYTTLPELAQFRALARLLKIQQYVSLADGHVGQAIDSMWEGLRLGYKIQQESLISGLVGISIDIIVLDGLAQHLDQLALWDCDRIIQRSQEWLKTPSPLLHVVKNEHQFSQRYLRKFHDDSEKLLKQLEEDTQRSNQPVDPAKLELEHYINDHPTAVGALVDQTMALANKNYEATLTNLSLPYWQRKSLARNSRASMADRLADFVLADYDRVLDRYDTEQARVHLLGVHAAIHRFQWQKNRLPNSLGELSLDDLIQDPYTGKPLVYIPGGDRYELYSAGPQGDRPAAGSGGPVTLPLKRK
jgi:hypothetical protein